MESANDDNRYDLPLVLLLKPDVLGVLVACSGGARLVAAAASAPAPAGTAPAAQLLSLNPQDVVLSMSAYKAASSGSCMAKDNQCEKQHNTWLCVANADGDT